MQATHNREPGILNHVFRRTVIAHLYAGDADHRFMELADQRGEGPRVSTAQSSEELSILAVVILFGRLHGVRLESVRSRIRAI